MKILMAENLMVAKLYRCDFEFCYGCGAKWASGCSCDDEHDEDSEEEDDDDDDM